MHSVRLVGASYVTVVSIVLLLTSFVRVADVPFSSFNLTDVHLIDCGSPDDTVLDDGRTFKYDPQSASCLSTDEDILTFITSFPNISLASSPVVALPLYLTARNFTHESIYLFPILKPGRHWICLHFYPLSHQSYTLTSATFTVTTAEIVLLRGFSVKNRDKMVLKEYLVNVTSDKMTLERINSFAFVNAIEVVSSPRRLIRFDLSCLPGR